MGGRSRSFTQRKRTLWDLKHGLRLDWDFEIGQGLVNYPLGFILFGII